MVAMYFARSENLELFLVDFHLKTLETELNRFSDTNIVKYKEFE